MSQQSSATFFCFFAGTGEEQTARGAFSDALVGDSRGIRLIKIFFSQPEHKFRLWIRGYAKSAAWCTYLDGAQGRSGRGSVRPDRGKDLRTAHPILRTATRFLVQLKGTGNAVELNQKPSRRIQIQPHNPASQFGISRPPSRSGLSMSRGIQHAFLVWDS